MIFCWKLKTHISSLPGKNFITKIPFPQPIRMRMISSIRQFLLNKIGLTKIKWQSYFKLMIRNGPKPKLLICSRCKCFFTLNAYPINILKARLQTWSESALMCWSFYAALYSVLCTHNVFCLPLWVSATPVGNSIAHTTSGIHEQRKMTFNSRRCKYYDSAFNDL